MAKVLLYGVGFAAICATLLFAGGIILQAKNFLITGLAPSKNNSEDLRAENTALRIELEKLLSERKQLDSQKFDTLDVFVFSAYPFNSKNELTIAAGKRDGVEPKMAVLVGGLLLGKVTSVYENMSIVQTIFDQDFESSVRVGEKAANALLRGGLSPRVELIPNDAGVVAGSGVYSTNSDFPYGLPIGEIKNFKKKEGDVLSNATLAIPYDQNDIRVVSVVLSTKSH